MIDSTPTPRPAVLPLTRSLVALGGQLYTLLRHMERAQKLRPGVARDPAPIILARLLNSTVEPGLRGRSAEELELVAQVLSAISETIAREIHLLPRSEMRKLQLERWR